MRADFRHRGHVADSGVGARHARECPSPQERGMRADFRHRGHVADSGVGARHARDMPITQTAMSVRVRQ